MKIKYRILTDIGYKNYKSELADFLLVFHYIFMAKAVPSFPIIYDLCKGEPGDWGGDNKVEWEKFALAESDYQAAQDELLKRGDFLLRDIPSEIDSVYKWDLYQYQLTHKVPYEEHKELADMEVLYSNRMKDAQLNKNEEELMLNHIKLAQASDELSDFLEEYIK